MTAGIAADVATALAYGNKPLRRRQLAAPTTTTPSSSSAAELQPLPTVRLLQWHRLGALIGFATIRVYGCLDLVECSVWCGSGGERWAALRSRPVLARDGAHHRVDEMIRQYQCCAAWLDRATADRWSAAVIFVVKWHDSDAFRVGAAWR